MTIKEKLLALRSLMKSKHIDAYIIVTDDFHGSEYVGDFFKARAFMSGFTGSAGTLVVTMSDAALWVDGRYYLQAESQLKDSTINMMKIGQPNVPSIAQYLFESIPENGTLGYDGRTINNNFANQLNNMLNAKNIRFLSDLDLVGEIWIDRPPLSKEPVWELEIEYAGKTRAQKLLEVRQKMADLGAEYLIVGALDEIAWLLNLRGNDVQCSPVFLSFMIIGSETATLCVHKTILNDTIQNELTSNDVTLAEYDEIYARISQLPAHASVLIDGASTNYRILQCIPESATVINHRSPICELKAVKNETEMNHLRTAHLKDGVAVTRFMYWLKHTIGIEPITELSAAEKILYFRSQMENFLGPSFHPILSYGSHAAIVHYSPTEESNIEFQSKSFCLADTGGHYLEGTTDITRTIALGTPTNEEKYAFTNVLRGHLNLANAHFLYGACGANLDILARIPLWNAEMDYNHGTGHGVGYLLNVHEGPQRIHWNLASEYVLEEGMVISNEPGYYLADKFGIRHENLVLCRKGSMNEHGQFMYFENLTMVPFDRDAIDPSLMSDLELESLNQYHALVFERISPFFDGNELEWLAQATAPITK